MDCIFCKVVAGEVPASVCFEDDKLLAFDDISPKAPVHKLIIPKKHIATLNEFSEEDEPLLGHMLTTATKLAKTLEIAEPGYRVIINCNPGGGQQVYHVHLHLIGGRKMTEAMG